MATEQNLPDEISKEEVWNVLEYANALYGQFRGADNALLNWYNPDLERKNLVDLNNNPLVPTLGDIKKAIANYKNDAVLLQEYSQFMNVWDSIYKKAIQHYKNILAFNWSYYCINANGSDYASKEYQDDLKRVYKFFEHFDIKEEFRIALENMLLNDVYFCWLRDSSGSFDDSPLDIDNLNVKRSQNFSLQMMPQKNCKITGKFYGGFLWDFNLNYFLNSTVNIENYDPSLIKAFKSDVELGKLKSYINNNSDLNKTNGYGYNGWTRTSVNDGAWVFKFNTSNFNCVPPLGYLLKSVFDDDVIAELQKNKDIISANAIILGEMKTKKDDKIGADKNAFTIDPKQVGQLMSLARRGIDKSIKQIALPLENVKLYQFADNNSNMAKNAYSSNAGQSVSASELIYSTEKMGQFALECALNEDYRFVSQVYSQFESFLNFFVNKKTKKYKFRFRVNGSTLPWLQTKEQDNIIKIIDKGILPNISMIASLYNIQPQELDSMMDEMKFGNTLDKLTLLLNTNTTRDGGNSNGAGRPETDSESANLVKDYDY